MIRNASPRAPALLHHDPGVPARAAYGFALLKFQLSSEKRDFILAPLVGAVYPPYPSVHGAPQVDGSDPGHSKRMSQSDIEISEDPWLATKGPVQRNSAPTAMTASVAKRYSSALHHDVARPGTGTGVLLGGLGMGPPVPPPSVPGRYMARYQFQPAAGGGGGGLGAGSAVYGEAPAPGGAGNYEADSEMAATIEQIQALNAQLTDMISGKGSPTRSYREAEEAAAALAAGAAAQNGNGGPGPARMRYAVDGGEEAV